MKAKFKFFPKMYMSESIDAGKLFFIKQKIKKGKGEFHVIVNSEIPGEMLEILSAKECKNPVYKDRLFYVGGISVTKGEAMQLVHLMTVDCQKIRNDLNLKEFIKCGQFF